MASKISKTGGSAPKRKRTSAPPAKLDGAVVVDVAVAATLSQAPTHEDIAFRAYELYQRRSYGDGCALSDWLAAERELRAG